METSNTDRVAPITYCKGCWCVATKLADGTTVCPCMAKRELTEETDLDFEGE